MFDESNNITESGHGQPGSGGSSGRHSDEDKAVVEVDNVLVSCEEYTEHFGYKCVPYYKCYYGTIITKREGSMLDVKGVKGVKGLSDSSSENYTEDKSEGEGV